MLQQIHKLTPDILFPKWSILFDYIEKLNEKTLEHSEWTGLIKKKRKEMGLDIGDNKTCVMGESHGFTSSYETCNICNGYACGGKSFVSLTHDLKHGLVSNWRNTDTVKGFINHFEQNHS